MCVAGGTGSGKSFFILYILHSLLRLPQCVQLYIGDFKKSGDYKGISDNFAEFDAVVELIEKFYDEFETTAEGSKTLKIVQNNKKKAEEIKGKISNLLMLGRSRNCYVWTVMQRASAQLFPSGIGAIDNYNILLGFGRLTVDSRRSLFATEHLNNAEFEEHFNPQTGQGLCLIDGQPLRAIQIPYIEDKERLKEHLQQLAKERQ